MATLRDRNRLALVVTLSMFTGPAVSLAQPQFHLEAAIVDGLYRTQSQTVDALGYNVVPGGIDFYRTTIQTRTSGVWNAPLVLNLLSGFRNVQTASGEYSISAVASMVSSFGNSTVEHVDRSTSESVWRGIPIVI